MRNYFRLLALASLVLTSLSTKAVSNRGFRADMSFLDFEDITELFSPHHKQVVHKISHSDSPLKIISAEVSDRGTVFFEGLSGAQNTYSIKVENTSGRNILAYEITWVLKHPFEDYVFHKIYTNSINPMRIDESQTLRFRRSKHYRDDAYYYVEVSKVEFDDDESIWEAPDLDDYKKHTRLDEVKKQIDAMKDDAGIEELSDEELEVLKEKYKEESDDAKFEENEPEIIKIESEELVEIKEVKKEHKHQKVEKKEKAPEKVQEPKKVETKVIETKTIVEPETTKTEVIETVEIVEEQTISDEELDKLLDEADVLIKRNRGEVVKTKSSVKTEKTETITETLEKTTDKVTEAIEKSVEAVSKSVEKAIEAIPPKTAAAEPEVDEDLDDDDDDDDWDDDEDFDDEEWDEDDEIDFGDDDDLDDF